VASTVGNRGFRKSGRGAILDGEKAANDAWLNPRERGKSARRKGGRANAPLDAISAVPVLAFLGTEGTGSFIASRLCGAKLSGVQRSGGRGEVENRFAETERATLRSILRAWRRSDTETRAYARRDGGECGAARRSSSDKSPRCIGFRGARCREGSNDAPRVGGDRHHARTSGKNNSDER